jgi:small subunit ribosomal protein S9
MATKSSKTPTYYEAVGRRKTSTARVRVFMHSKKKNEITVNDKPLTEFFDVEELQTKVVAPLKVLAGGADVSIKVQGGGTTGQADAAQLGLARALVKFDSELKKQLKDNGLLTRDPRQKERKKPGLKKARRSPQWAKR